MQPTRSAKTAISANRIIRAYFLKPKIAQGTPKPQNYKLPSNENGRNKKKRASFAFLRTERSGVAGKLLAGWENRKTGRQRVIRASF
jgi:hypothetical protein